MKTTIYTMIALFALNANMIFAGGIKFHTMPYNTEYNDGNEFKAAPDVMVSKLAPVTPKVADFEEALPMYAINVESLVPATPKVADFEDAVAVRPDSFPGLAPALPVVADFTE